MTRSHARPWYCLDSAVDEYRETIDDDGEPLPMLKTLKIVLAIIVNLAFIGVGGYAIYAGAHPTIIGGLALVGIGGYNGLEYSDYMALIQAYQEIQDEQQ